MEECSGKVASMRQKIFIFGVPFVAVLLLLSFPMRANARFFQEEDDSTRIHRLHVLMNHGLIMYLDGINMKMISKMRMSSLLDTKTRDYALQNMERGKKAIELALNGDQKEILIEQGFGDHPLMKTALELGGTMLELLAVLDKMDMEQMTGERMEIHYMHLLLNKGLKDVAQGSNMIMTTLLVSIPQIDRYIENQGWINVKMGKTLMEDVTRSDPFRQTLKMGDPSGVDSLLTQTRQFAQLSQEIAAIISRMNIGGNSQ